MKKVNLLSKAEMKKVSGGNPPNEGGLHLHCYTPNGEEDWSRPNCDDATATQECRDIYPLYGSEVTGKCIVTIHGNPGG